MKRSRQLLPRRFRVGPYRRPARHAYTLVEILTATVLMLIIMMAVTVIFANVTDSIGQSRSTLNMTQQLRSTVATLSQDLDNVTVVMSPPRHPRDGQGYFEYVEGPIGPIVQPFQLYLQNPSDPTSMAVLSNYSINSDREGEVNGIVPLDVETTAGDIDDIIMFTVTSKGEPYTGLIGNTTQTANSAEIIWFVRGRTLYRRVLLIKPEIDVRSVSPYGFYSDYDLSVHKTWDDATVTTTTPTTTQHRPVLKANSLADLTTPSCRFAHHPDPRAFTDPQPTPIPANVSGVFMNKGDSVRYMTEGKVYPFFLRPWLGAPIPGTDRWVPGLGLPILAESSTPYTQFPTNPPNPTAPWPAGAAPWVAGDAIPSENAFGVDRTNPMLIQMPPLPASVEPSGPFDPWTPGREHPWTNVDPNTGAMAAYRVNATRVSDDVIMTNVIGFDVKAWDPNAPIFSHTTGNPLNPEVVVMPGDPGYIARLRTFQETVRIAGFASTSGLPPTGAYVDLNYMAKIPRYADPSGRAYYPDNPAVNTSGTLPPPIFARQGHPKSLAYGTQWPYALGEHPYPPDYGPSYQKQPYEYFPAIYDTWSLHYEYNYHGVSFVSDSPYDANRAPAPVPVGNEDRDTDGGGNQLYDEGTDGLDNDGASGVDDVGERETQPPYTAPLQGIQIRIRAFEPSSRQVREVTIVHKFRTK